MCIRKYPTPHPHSAILTRLEIPIDPDPEPVTEKELFIIISGCLFSEIHTLVHKISPRRNDNLIYIVKSMTFGLSL